MKTLEKVGQEIAAFILQSPLMACLGYEDKETGRRYAVEALGDIASGATQAKKSFSNIFRLTFRRADTEVSIDIDADVNFGDKLAEQRAENGDDYYPANIKIDLSWPSHGSRSPRATADMIKLYSEAVELAKEIEAKFGQEPIWFLLHTKAEREAREAKEAQKELDNQVRALIASHNSRMRVGQAKAIFGAESLPEGDYEQEVAKKAFKVTKGPAMTFLIRLT
jgi:hypothetical protein